MIEVIVTPSLCSSIPALYLSIHSADILECTDSDSLRKKLSWNITRWILGQLRRQHWHWPIRVRVWGYLSIKYWQQVLTTVLTLTNDPMRGNRTAVRGCKHQFSVKLMYKCTLPSPPRCCHWWVSLPRPAPVWPAHTGLSPSPDSPGLSSPRRPYPPPSTLCKYLKQMALVKPCTNVA